MEKKSIVFNQNKQEKDQVYSNSEELLPQLNT